MQLSFSFCSTHLYSLHLPSSHRQYFPFSWFSWLHWLASTQINHPYALPVISLHSSGEHSSDAHSHL